MRIDEAISEFLLEQKVRGNSEKTLIDYRQKLGQFRLFIGDVDVSEISVRRCKEWQLWLMDRDLQTASVQGYVRSARAFLHWLFLEDLIAEDLCTRFRVPKGQQKRIDVLTDQEIYLIYSVWPDPGSWVDARNRVIVSLMLDAGLRLSELVTAKRSNLHLRERYLIVDGKGAKQRAVVFGIQTERMLGDYLIRAPEVDPLIISSHFLNHPSAPITGITGETVKDLFRVIRRRTGIRRLHPHLLRHTFATRYMENGGRERDLQDLLGHTSSKMTQRYVHMAQRSVRREFVNFSPLDRLEDEKNPPTK